MSKKICCALLMAGILVLTNIAEAARRPRDSSAPPPIMHTPGSGVTANAAAAVDIAPQGIRRRRVDPSNGAVPEPTSLLAWAALFGMGIPLRHWWLRRNRN